MHVFLITQYFPPEIGAASSRWGDYVDLLIKQGNKVTVLCEIPNYPKGNYFSGYKRAWVKKDIISPELTIIRSAAFATDRKSNWKKLIHYFVFTFSALFNAFKVRSYDLVIISSPPLFVGLIGVILNKWKQTDFWLDIRDLWPESALALKQINKSWVYFFGKRLEKIIYNSAKGFIIAVPGFNKYFRKEFQFEFEKPILNLINGVSTNFIEKAKIVDYKKPKRFTVLYSGNIGLAQGLETIIESARLLIDYPIDFIFVGNGVCREDLQSLVEKNKQKNVFFHDMVNRDELIKFIKQASVCLVPLKNYPLFNFALPSKMFEYMACSRPVIVGVKGEIENIINTSDSGIIVEPENPTKFSEAILNYYRNPDKAIKAGRNGMIYITNHLVKEELISILLDKIKKV